MVVGKNRRVATVVISCMRDEVSAKLIKIISERATSRRGDLGEVPRPAAARAVPPPWYNHASNETQVVSLLRTHYFKARDHVHLLGLLPARRTSSARRRRGS